MHTCGRSILALTLAAVALATPRTVQAAAGAASLEARVAAVEPATLVIFGRRVEGGASVQGSGVCVDERGLVLTTAHQVAGVESLEGANDDYRCRLEVIAWDDERDLALLRADRAPPASVVVGDAAELAKGAPVFVLSAPAGLRLTLAAGSIATTGVFLNDQPRVQVDVTLAEGASGGPVFDFEGRLIGIVSARAEGLAGFTIVTPINEAYPLLDAHGVMLPEGAGGAWERVDPAGADAAERRAIDAYNRGVEASEPGEKIRHYEAAVSYAPDFFEAWFNLGAARSLAGQAVAAVEAYREAHALRPDSQRVLRNYGQALLEAGDARGAVRVLDELASRSPGDARALNDLGEAHRRMGEFESAAGCFREALSSEPDYAPAHFNLGLALVQLERRAEAVSAFEQYLALRPSASDAAQVVEAIERLRKDLP